MKRTFQWVLAATLICGASVMTSCSSNDDNPAPQSNIAEKIIGKWMVEELDGEPCPTNLKTVLTFVSPTKAYGSLSDFSTPMWNVKVLADVKIDGNKVNVINTDGNIRQVLDCTILSITDKDLLMSSDWNIYEDGEKIYQEAYGKERYARITADYSQDILGTWEGKVTSENDEHTDGEMHRWEYKADGTYVYYNKVGTEWVANNDALAEYFVDGTLLCTRWKKTADSEELREWWEIESISDGVMKWTALRKKADGSTYTATFEMKKVPVPTEKEIVQNIIGKWITADGDGQPVVTNEKVVLDIVSTTNAYISASFNHNPAAGKAWFHMLGTDVIIDGNKMVLTTQYGENTTAEYELTIADISASEFTAYLKFSMKVGGSVVRTKEYPVRYVKMAADYSQAILGTWEGKVTSENDEHTDGEMHRWEYKADGTYVYYNKVGTEWVANNDALAEYFVDGTLLCTRWKKTADSEELREWWEIESISDGVMKWTALRKKADGSTYTATFEMTKVK